MKQAEPPPRGTGITSFPSRCSGPAACSHMQPGIHGARERAVATSPWDPSVPGPQASACTPLPRSLAAAQASAARQLAAASHPSTATSCSRLEAPRAGLRSNASANRWRAGCTVQEQRLACSQLEGRCANASQAAAALTLLPSRCSAPCSLAVPAALYQSAKPDATSKEEGVCRDGGCGAASSGGRPGGGGPAALGNTLLVSERSLQLVWPASASNEPPDKVLPVIMAGSGRQARQGARAGICMQNDC